MAAIYAVAAAAFSNGFLVILISTASIASKFLADVKPPKV
jgi:hypothetical protein